MRHLPAQVWIISVATLINRSVGFLALFSAIYFQSFDRPANVVTLALLVVGVAGVLGAMAGGWIAERVGPGAVLSIGSLVNVPLLIILAMLGGNIVASILVTAISVAVSQSFVGPSAAVVSASTDQVSTVTLFAFYRIFLNVGSVVAPALAGIFGLGNFRLLFLLSAAGSFVAFVLLSTTLRGSGARAAAEPEEDGAVDDSMAEPDSQRWRIWTVIAVFGVTIAIYAQHQSGIPLSVERLPEGARLYAILLLINPIVIIVAELPLSTVTARLKWGNAYGIGIFATAVGLAICGVSGSWALCIAAFVLFSVGEAIFAPLANSSIATLSKPQHNARYQGYLSAAQSLGIALGPAIGAWGVLHNRSLFWIAVAVLGAVLAAVSVFAGTGRKSSREPVQVPA
ncbi:MFS transporter [Nocardia sp. NPDC049149]|uniref:MFS transporter n=1 Tax=Nocardia sp. NPDC049149 TaxID=3364315 RepID=UPI003712D2E5